MGWGALLIDENTENCMAYASYFFQFSVCTIAKRCAINPAIAHKYSQNFQFCEWIEKLVVIQQTNFLDRRDIDKTDDCSTGLSVFSNG